MTAPYGRHPPSRDLEVELREKWLEEKVGVIHRVMSR